MEYCSLGIKLSAGSFFLQNTIKYTHASSCFLLKLCKVCRYKTFIYTLAMRLPEFFFYLCHWPVEWPWTNHSMTLASVLSPIKFRHWWGDHQGPFNSNIPWPNNFKPYLKKDIVTSLTEQNTYCFHRSQFSQRWRKRPPVCF